MKSLTELEIYRLETVKCVPERWLRHLTALEKLMVCYCYEVVELSERIKHLEFLKNVRLQCLPKMVILPKVLQRLSSSLQSLELHDLIRLESLPDWLDKLASLEPKDCIDTRLYTRNAKSPKKTHSFVELFWVS